MLLREHPIGDTDKETVNALIITRILRADWGYWRTFTGNLKLLNETLDRYDGLLDEDRQIVRKRIGELESRIEAVPKTLVWKARAKIGERVKWYKDVEELER
jgi:hypothetical protein